HLSGRALRRQIVGVGKISVRHETEEVRSRHHAEASMLCSRWCQAEPNCGHARGLELFGETVLMPADERVATAKFVEQPRGLQHDVWSNKLFHAIEYARVRAELPGPAKVVVRLVQTRDTTTESRARLIDFGAKMAHLIRRENRDRVEEAKFLVVS